MNTELKLVSSRTQPLGLHHWGRATHAASKTATKTDVKQTLGSQGDAAIARAEKAAQARMAQFRTLKTVPRPREGVLARLIRSMFG